MFVMRADYAYGAAGKPPKVFPGATVQFEIELLRWKDSLPRFPSQEELARSKKERQEEERRQ